MYRNPFYKKFEIAPHGEPSATYGGIALKSIWFLLLTFIGVASFLWAPNLPNHNAMLIACGITATILPFIIFWIPSTAPLLGTIHSFAQGYLVALLCSEYAKEYSGIVVIALVITAVVFLSLLILYASGVIKVGNKFKAIGFTLFMSSILIYGIVFVSSFFTPVLRNIFYGNGIIGYSVAIISLLLSIFNLVIEFDNIAKTVQHRLRKKYEWLASYGLIMTIVILFMRVLRIVAKILGEKEK